MRLLYALLWLSVRSSHSWLWEQPKTRGAALVARAGHSTTGYTLGGLPIAVQCGGLNARNESQAGCFSVSPYDNWLVKDLGAQLSNGTARYYHSTAALGSVLLLWGGLGSGDAPCAWRISSSVLMCSAGMPVGGLSYGKM